MKPTTTTTTTAMTVEQEKKKQEEEIYMKQWYLNNMVDPSKVIPSMKPFVTMRIKDEYHLSSLLNNNHHNQQEKKSHVHRRHSIRQSFMHAYHNYEKYAMGSDELKPLSKSMHNWAKNPHNQHLPPNHYQMAMTLIDSLDTMFLMGMSSEFNRALEYLASESFPHCSILDWDGSVFETTIRVIGGMLSAYEMATTTMSATTTTTATTTTMSSVSASYAMASTAPTFAPLIQNLLTKAKEYADCLMPAFSSNTGLPYSSINFKSGEKRNYSWNHMSSILSEFGSVQLEFRKLSQLTRDAQYDEAVTRVMNVMKRHEPSDGLYPVMFHPEQAQWTGDVQAKLGALGDSYYEYLLKQYLLTNKSESMYRDMYNRAVTGIMNRLTFVFDKSQNDPKSNNNNNNNNNENSSKSDKKKNDMTVFLAELINGHYNYKEDHLVCFMAGMIALGEHHHVHDEQNDSSSSNSLLSSPCKSSLFQKYGSLFSSSSTSSPSIQSPQLKNRSHLNDRTVDENGYERYANPMIQLAHGIVNGCYETYRMSKTGLGPETFRFNADNGDVSLDARHYILRPETVESLFVLYRVTNNTEYGEMGWNIFESIEKYCRTEHGYSGIRNVDQIPPVHDDMQQSFFLAETLKYLFLLFVEDHSIVSLDEWVFNTEAHPLRIISKPSK